MTKWIIIYLCILGISWYYHNPAKLEGWGMSCFLFSVGWFGFFYQYEFFKRAVMVPGKVIRMDLSWERGWWEWLRRRGQLIEVIAFEYKGEQREIDGQSNYVDHTIGEHRQVGVDPAHPAKARIFLKTDYKLYVCMMLFSPIFYLLPSR